MSLPRIDNMKDYIAFDGCDADNLQSLADVISPAIPHVLDRFYEEIKRHPDAMAVLSQGEAQIEKLRETMKIWMRGLFCGNYDQAYFDKRATIGREHVRVSLPQHYMVTAMEVIWQGLEEAVRQMDIPRADEKLRSLHKLLMLELCLMLESYKDSYASKIREMEHHLIEVRLTRAEHLAEIGQLAASLAHEVKNPLAGISGAIQIIRDGMAKDDDRRPIVGEILAQISRLDAAVKDLLLYARPSEPEVTPCSMENMMRRVLIILQTEPALEGITVIGDASLHRTAIYADEGKLEQLLINLIINAAHASKPGDRIRVTASTEADTVRLVVSDNGKGMTAEVQQRALEPFFTTKAKGTGLGLPICRRIVESHNGRIELYSEPGRGTSVSVTLPQRKPAAPYETNPTG